MEVYVDVSIDETNREKIKNNELFNCYITRQSKELMRIDSFNFNGRMMRS
jgi:hypothetical protein